MQIRRFYVPELNSAERIVSLPECESQHALRVLRLQPGDELLLLNGRGLTARAELLPPPEGVRRPRQALCNVIEVQLFPQSEPALELCVAPPRGKAFELVLKAATELGFAVIQPILCRYGVARPDGAADSWQETLVAALKQSCKPWLPEVRAPREFATALADGVHRAHQHARRGVQNEHIFNPPGKHIRPCRPQKNLDEQENVHFRNQGGQHRAGGGGGCPQECRGATGYGPHEL